MSGHLERSRLSEAGSIGHFERSGNSEAGSSGHFKRFGRSEAGSSGHFERSGRSEAGPSGHFERLGTPRQARVAISGAQWRKRGNWRCVRRSFRAPNGENAVTGGVAEPPNGEYAVTGGVSGGHFGRPMANMR